jgi:hypothetical protein
MAALTRVLRLGVALPSLALAAAGCGSSVAGAAGASSPAPSRSLSLSYSVGPFMTPSSGGIVVTPRPSGPVVYLAEGGDPRGTALHAPRCPAGCPISGDGTTVLWNMTWPTWTSTEAVGTGTEKINDCDPSCASGQLHAVQVIVTLTKPVLACSAGDARRLWARASFAYPNGLPAALSGENAPVNPMIYGEIAAESAKHCA